MARVVIPCTIPVAGEYLIIWAESQSRDHIELVALGCLGHLFLPLPHVVVKAEFSEVSPAVVVAILEVLLGQVAAYEKRVQSIASSNGLAIVFCVIALRLDGLGKTLRWEAQAANGLIFLA